jgi:hypothetical protein
MRQMQALFDYATILRERFCCIKGLGSQTREIELTNARAILSTLIIATTRVI